jgi:DnaK suppressor protein
MSRATTVKKKPVAKAAKPKKPATRAAPPRAARAARAAKPAKSVQAAVKSAKPVAGLAKPQKPAPRRVSGPVAAPDAASAIRRNQERYAGLSKSDLLKAPASQYMNSAQLAFFRAHLLAMQRELLDKADMTSEHLREHDIEPDPTDQATIEEEYALELRARDRERKLLKKIEQALRRIDDGSYGYCEETGEAIGIPRLLARPTATLTIEAQARRELKQKLYGD